MKRSHEDAEPMTSEKIAEIMNGHALSAESTSLKMLMLIKNNEAGAVIGKGGAQLKDLREASGCKLTVAEAASQGATDRLVTIVGPPLSCNRCVQLILDKLEEVKAGSANGAADGVPTDPTQPATSLKLCVSDSQVGALIGKGGAQVKEIREGSGANVKIESPAHPGQDPRIVIGNGSKAEVVKAHQLIALKLSTLPEHGPPGNPSKYARHAPPVSQQQITYGVPPHGAYPTAYPGAPPPYYGGAYPSMPPAPGACSACGYAYGGQYPPPGTAPYGSYVAPYGMPPAIGSRSSGAVMPHSSTAMRTWAPATPSGGPDGEMMQLVPTNLVGRLIGKGGSGIRELRETSHAQIKIHSECEPGTEMRKVLVSGPPEAVQNALMMISAKLLQGP